MKSYYIVPIALALATLSTSAFAGRDEVLIQQTRKNQLAYEARVKQERLDKQQKEENRTAQVPAGASSPAPEHDAGAQPVAAPGH